ncbi:MAG: glutathione synthase [Myxococcales bacterium]|nr:glutathione synthase [Myxococcales bacterium]MCB9643693.1 glutathione synthase [Myxococcales bacterium]
MTVQLGVVMDPIQSIKMAKDTTFGMLLAAQARDWDIWYMEQADLWVKDGRAHARMRKLRVQEDPQHWFDFLEEKDAPLKELDALLMRKDPPFDMEFVYTTYALERAEEEGVLVLNKPQALRDANEKFYLSWFPQCAPETLITRSASRIKDFVLEHDRAVLKPLDGMGGASIFSLKADDPNLNVCIETVTKLGKSFAMVQKFIPEISQGDKRLLLIDGEPASYVLARIPPKGEFRGNLAVGGTGVAQPLSDRDRWIAEQVGPTLREKGMIFVGLDIIGDYLTEINVTSPTGMREINKAYKIDLGGQLMDAIQRKLDARNA